MNDTVYIYGLRELDGPIRYIGKTKNTKRRRRQHLTGKHLREWLATFNDPDDLTLEILEEVPVNIGLEREKYYIASFIEQKAELFNIINAHYPSLNPSKLIERELWACTCNKCGFSWETRTNKVPKTCGKCKSIKWDS